MFTLGQHHIAVKLRRIPYLIFKKTDIGIEGKLFGERLNFVVDVFYDKRDGIYQERQQIPDYAGLQKMPFGNVGKMVSYGSDGNISFTQNINKNMSFTLRGNLLIRPMK